MESTTNKYDEMSRKLSVATKKSFQVNRNKTAGCFEFMMEYSKALEGLKKWAVESIAIEEGKIKTRS